MDLNDKERELLENEFLKHLGIYVFIPTPVRHLPREIGKLIAASGGLLNKKIPGHEADGIYSASEVDRLLKAGDAIAIILPNQQYRDFAQSAGRLAATLNNPRNESFTVAETWYHDHATGAAIIIKKSAYGKMAKKLLSKLATPETGAQFFNEDVYTYLKALEFGENDHQTPERRIIENLLQHGGVTKSEITSLSRIAQREGNQLFSDLATSYKNSSNRRGRG